MRSTGIDDRSLALRRARAQRIRGLYAVTPDLGDTPELAARVAAAIDGGASAIQYRNKIADGSTRRIQAGALARVQAAHGALLIVNDDAELAAAIGADGVHIGESDASIGAAREIVGPDRLVGVSCYNDFARAEAAVAAGADYVAFGSFFASSVKPDARKAGIELLGRSRGLGVPVVAIGGIDATNAGELARAGADAVAVISAVFGQPAIEDVEAAAQAIARLFAPPPIAFRVEHVS
jgi:thiamine-phosphate pyrophosphorylase